MIYSHICEKIKKICVKIFKAEERVTPGGQENLSGTIVGLQ